MAKTKMKAKIDIKNNRGEVIFSFEKENNSLKDTVEEAVREDVSLIRAEFGVKDLSGVNLRGADLRCVNFEHTNLIGANLCDADLSFSHMECANLSGAELRYADLDFSYMEGANLSGANLIGAKLRLTKLKGADLKGADLEGANIYNLDFSTSKNVPNLPLVCPSEGEFIAWKKIHNYAEVYEGEFLVKLLIPEDAKRSSATSNKCRCSKAKVLDITNIETCENVDVITNINKTKCVYRVGEMVYPDSFDDNRWKECSNGIHFFMDRQDAMNY